MYNYMNLQTTFPYFQDSLDMDPKILLPAKIKQRRGGGYNTSRIGANMIMICFPYKFIPIDQRFATTNS